MNNKPVVLFLIFMLALAGSAMYKGKDVTAAEFSINECTDITTPGHYYLTGNISSSGTCIRIMADNVVLDGNGYYVLGENQSSTYGVLISGSKDNPVKNVVIKNLGAKYWTAGIYMWYTENSQIINSSAFLNKAGIMLFRSHNNTLSGNTVKYYCGFLVGSEDGIILIDSNGNLVEGNLISYNGGDGISLSNSSNNIIRGNDISHNGIGIHIVPYSPSEDNIIENNTIHEQSTGIYLGSNNNIVRHNYIFGHSFYGIHLYSSGHVIYDNYFNNTENVYNEFGYVSWNTTLHPGTNIIGGQYIGGNAWATPAGTGYSETCSDDNGDGICDSPYIVSSRFHGTDYYPLAFPREHPPSPQITSCTVIDRPGYYELENDIVNSQETVCINITASNVILNGNGFMIGGTDGASTSGIYIYSPSGIENITVFNIFLTDWEYGLYARNTENLVLDSILTTSNDIGMYIQSSDGVSITNLQATDNSKGIYLSLLNSGTLEGGTFMNNEEGIYLSGSTLNMMGINVVSNSLGMLLIYSRINITQSYIIRNDLGMKFMPSSGSLIFDNYFNNTKNVEIQNPIPGFTSRNSWNTTLTDGINIIGGDLIGGNFWALANGEGFSESCPDFDGNGICDVPYEIDENNIDYLPLRMPVSEKTVLVYSGTPCEAAPVMMNSLQDAINLAGENWTIKICPGVYNEEVTASGKKNIRIIGLESPEEIMFLGLTLENFENTQLSNVTFYQQNNVHPSLEILNSKNISVKNVKVLHGSYGVYVENSEEISLYNVEAQDNTYGIYVKDTQNLTMRNNNMEENNYNFYLMGNFMGHSIDRSNKVDGKDVLFVYGAQNYVFDDPTIGTLYCIFCDNVTVRNLELSKNGYGVLLYGSAHSTVENIKAESNLVGVAFVATTRSTIGNSTFMNNYRAVELGSNNGLYHNYIKENNVGIYAGNYNTLRDNLIVDSPSEIESHNLIYNNYFINVAFPFGFLFPNGPNSLNTTKSEGENIAGGNWIGGNVWLEEGNMFSSTCQDSDQDGICDDPFVIDQDNVDYLPLKIPWLCVNPSGICCDRFTFAYTSIFQALMNSKDGDTIRVCPGTYNEHFSIPSHRKLLGLSSLGTVTLTDSEPLNLIDVSDIQICGFRIERSGDVKAIYMEKTSNITLRGNDIVTENGEGVYLQGENSHLSILENTINGAGNGIYGMSIIDPLRPPTDWGVLSNIEISGNSISTSGYGIFLLDPNNATIAENNVETGDKGITISGKYTGACRILGNSIRSQGTGIWIVDSKGCMLWNNDVKISGDYMGIVVSNGNSTSIEGNSVELNSQYSGVYISASGNTSIKDTSIKNSNPSGRAVTVSRSNNVTVERSTFNSSIALWVEYSTGGLYTRNVVIGDTDVLSASGNLFYNNMFYGDYYVRGSENKWNITKTPGINIVGGPFLGGNYWQGFSDSCNDLNKDGICDSPYVLDSLNIDYLPLIMLPKFEISFIPPTPENGTSYSLNFLNATLYSSRPLTEAFLEVDGSNYTMNFRNGVWNLFILLGEGHHNYRAYATSVFGQSRRTEYRTLIVDSSVTGSRIIRKTSNGSVEFESDKGYFSILKNQSLEALPQEVRDSMPDNLFMPYGLFNFTITGLDPGERVTLTVRFPDNVPVGSRWWKVDDAGNWYSIPIGSDDGDNTVTVTLEDGGIGDSDGSINGIITDPSGIGFFREDRKPPSISIRVFPEIQDIGKNVTVEYEVKDNTRINVIVLRIINATSVINESYIISNKKHHSGIFNFTVGGVGTYEVTVWANDTSGNEAQKTVTFLGRAKQIENLSLKTNSTTALEVEDAKIIINPEENGSVKVNITISPEGEGEFKLGEDLKYINVCINRTVHFGWVILNVTYDEELLRKLGMEESTVKLFYWNGSEWIDLENSIGKSIPDNTPYGTLEVYGFGRNTTENYVWANISHLSQYLLALEYPDLSVTGITPNRTYTGEKTLIAVEVHNSGGAVQKSFNMTVYLNGTLYATKEIEGIGSGETRKILISWTPQREGAYELRVVVDLNDVIKESNETNNEYLITVKVSNRKSPTTFVNIYFRYGFIYYKHYNKMLEEFKELYNEALEKHIDNETVDIALKYAKLAEGYYRVVEKQGIFQNLGNPRMMGVLRLAYLNIRKAVEILKTALALY